MFRFEMEDFGPQMFDVDKADITLFRHAVSGADTFSLGVNVSAKPREVVPTKPKGEPPYRMAPALYTEWLDIPDTALVTRDAGCLAGYQMIYDEDREEELGFDQFPGAIYQDSHAPFAQAILKLTYLGGLRYRVVAAGETEFGWMFQIDEEATFQQITLRDGMADSKGEPDPLIEAEFASFFEEPAFSTTWKRQGNDNYFWYDYVAKPRDAKNDEHYPA